MSRIETLNSSREPAASAVEWSEVLGWSLRVRQVIAPKTNFAFLYV